MEVSAMATLTAVMVVMKIIVVSTLNQVPYLSKNRCLIEAHPLILMF